MFDQKAAKDITYDFNVEESVVLSNQLTLYYIKKGSTNGTRNSIKLDTYWVDIIGKYNVLNYDK